jgi:hypothetical protein
MFKVKVLVFSLLLVFAATNAYAGDVDGCESSVGSSCWDAYSAYLYVNICPCGLMEYISDGCNAGVEDTHYVYAYVKDASGNPIQGIPEADWWLYGCGSNLCICADGFSADFPTDIYGYTEFSGRIKGGGCADSVYLSCQGKPIMQSPSCILYDCVELETRSPDLVNADCDVNVSDFTAFALAYGPYGTYNSCADYNDDGVINLSDFTYFAIHYGHTCPH